MILDPRDIVLFFIGGLNIVLGILVFFRKVKNWINLSYTLLALAILVWTAGLVFFDNADNLSTALIWARVYYLAAAFIAYIFLNFCFAFPYKKIRYTWHKHIIFLTPLIVTCIIIFTPYHIDTISIQPWGKDILLGWGYVLYTVYFVMYMGIGFFSLWKKGIESVGIRKLQVRYVLIGTLIATSGASVTNLVYPLLGNYKFIWLGPIFTIFLIVFMALAIVRYKLMNIRFVLGGVVKYCFSFATSFIIIGITLHFSGSFGSDIINTRLISVSAILSVLAMSLYEPFGRLYTKITDRIFFRNQPDYQILLKNIGHIIAEEFSQEGLVYSVSRKLNESISVKHVRIYILDKTTNNYIVLGSKHESMSTSSQIITTLGIRTSVLVTEQIELLQNDAPDKYTYLNIGKLVDELHHFEVSLAMPVILEGKLIAIIALGPRQSKDIFDRELINSLDVIAPQIATALTKTRLYDESKQFANTLKKKVEEATSDLKIANRHLKQLDQSKSEFLSIAAHQLRTPLTGIKGYISMFLEGDFGKLTTEQHDQLARIFRSSDRLTRLIDVFLNVSRIETGRLDIDKTKVSLDTILDSVVNDLKKSAEDKNLKITVQKPNKGLPIVLADEDKIHDVMMNLVDNAIKYTQQGWINIRISHSKSLISFEVRDSGIGIDAIEITTLFQKFSRAEAVTRIHTGGSGLGLFIARKIIEAHGGRIWAESDGEGKGAMFTFTIPIITIDN